MLYATRMQWTTFACLIRHPILFSSIDDVWDVTRRMFAEQGITGSTSSWTVRLTVNMSPSRLRFLMLGIDRWMKSWNASISS